MGCSLGLSVADFGSFRKLATTLIAKYGASVTHTMRADRVKTYDSTEDELTGTGTPTSQTVYAVISPYTPLFGLGPGQSFEQGTRKKAQSRSLSIAAAGLAFEPEPGDTFTFEGRTWEATMSKKTGPDGLGIVFNVGVTSP